MPPSELAKRLRNLQSKSNALLIALIALNRDSNELIEVLDGYDADMINEAVRTYGVTLEYLRVYLEAFCAAAGKVFNEE